MRFLKKYVKFLKENTIAPSKPTIAPTKPVPPVKPERKDRTIKEPKVKPGPLAKTPEKLAEEVAYTFIAEMSKAGESVEKYLN
jgi:hypothetical protein